MTYIRLHFQTDPTRKEALLALLSELPFEAFEEVNDGWLTGMNLDLYDQDLKAQLGDLQRIIPFLLEETILEKRNWNELWAQNFEPIRIRDLIAVRAPFHQPMGDVAHEIIIEPRMAFGTGHHETTQLMMLHMTGLLLEGKAVLDYGSGTGILAILSEKLGASSIDALEIDKVAFENLLQNIDVNHCSRIHAIHGDLERISQNQYDVILANITRNVILDSLDVLTEVAKEGAYLVVSGFLERDGQAIIDAIKEEGGKLVRSDTKSGWMAISFQLKN